MTKDELKARMTDLLKDELGGAELPSHRSVQKLRELAEASKRPWGRTSRCASKRATG